MRQMRSVVSLFAACVLILTLVLTACSPAETRPDDEVVLRPNTVVADEETEDVLTTVTEEQDVLIFGASTPLLDELKPGDVIIMGATDHTPNGLLRRVTDVTHNGEQVIVETEFATMEDAIEEGTIAVSAPITATDFQSTTLGLDGIEVLQGDEGIGFTITIDRTIDDFHFTGELTFHVDPVINIDVTYWPPGLKELEFTIETDESLDIQVEAEADVVDFHRKIQLLPTIEKHILIPKPPVWVVIYFTPVLIVEGNLSGSLQARVEYVAQRKGGLHYQDGSWNTIGEQDSQFSGQAELAVQTDLRVATGSEVVVEFYSVVGPTGSIYGYLEFEAGLDALPWWDLYGGLEAELGITAEFPIFGWEIGYGPVEVMHYRWLLAEHQSDEEDPVYFACPNLEAAIREAIGKPTGDIYPSDLEGLTSLYASDKNISDLTGLEYATSLTELNLRANQISDISPLEGLTNLTWLRLTGNQISDTSPLSNLTNLRHLDVWTNQISDVSPLANLTNLTVLWLGANEISDISPLSNLADLTSLHLTSNQISDISALSNLTNLVELDLGRNSINDISPLASLANLQDLGLSRNQISDISPLADLTNLEWLSLRDNQISDISPLEGLTSLTELRLRSNEISDISPLAGLTSLTFLHLSFNQISDFSPLANLTNLTRLWLSGNEISDISHLEDLTNLIGLRLGGNQISDISPLGGLTNLTHLNLNSNQISDFSPLEGLSNLTSLSLIYSHISDISPLAALTNLTWLLLDSNQISDISPLEGLTNLTTLHLKWNQINDISPLEGLTNLGNLALAVNQISDISPLEGLTNLTHLDLRSNEISDIKPLVDNAGLGEGDEVWLFGNPLSEQSVDEYIPELEARGVDVVY